MKKLYIFALMAMMLAACTTDELNEQSVKFEGQIPDSITVSFEGESSRIQLNEAQKTVWTEGDLVSVFYKSNANRKWQYQGETGARTGELKQIATSSATATTDKVVVAYPYSNNYLLNLTTGDIEATLPVTQHYLKDSYGLDGNLMVSSGYFTQFSLKTVCGWLKVQLTGNGEQVQSIKFKGNNGEQVAGLIYVNTETAACTLASEMGAVGDDGEGAVGGAGGNLVFEGAVVKEVTLDCGEGVTLSAEPTAFYIALPPQTFTQGLTIQISSPDGSTMTKTTEKAITIERNYIQPMAALQLELEAPTPSVPNIPNNEIWYTATEQIRFWDTPNFDANIITHNWDATTGKGVITFDKDITIIGDGALRSAQMSLTSIILPNSITSIGVEALSECGNLTEVVLPNRLESIGEAAFWDCASLKTITIPESVTTIGDGVFASCSSLTSFHGKFASEDKRCLIIEDRLNSFAPANLTEYTIPSNVISIGNYVFEMCSLLTSIILPNNITTIGDGAFVGCESLKNITIPNSVTEIGIGAFASCYSLSSFYGKFASEDNRCLIIEGSIHSFAPAGVTEYTIPNGATSIGYYAFASNELLTSLIISEGITTIEDEGVCGCDSLTSVIIPNSVTYIGHEAFAYNELLKDVYCKPTTPPIGSSWMFESNATDRKIYVPAISLDAYQTSPYWSEYKDSFIAEGQFFYEDCGQTITKDENGYWPYVDQFIDWNRQGNAAANTIYTGKNASIRNSGLYYQPTSEAIGASGQPYVFINRTPLEANFLIENITVVGDSNYIFTFNVSCQNSYSNAVPTFANIDNSLVHLELGYDGKSWDKIDCIFTPNGGNGWYAATAEFKVAADATTLYARFSYEAPASNGGCRLDDFRLVEGGNGTYLAPEAPAFIAATIADITTAGIYYVSNAWVVATYADGCLLTDNSGAYILAYKPSITPTIGDRVNILGTVSTYAGLLQFGAGSTISTTGSTIAVSHPTAEVLDAAMVNSLIGAIEIKYVEYSGVLSISNNKYYNVAIDGTTNMGSIQYPNEELKNLLTTLNGKIIKVVGYTIGASSGKYLNTMAVSVEAIE